MRIYVNKDMNELHIMETIKKWKPIFSDIFYSMSKDAIEFKLNKLSSAILVFDIIIDDTKYPVIFDLNTKSLCVSKTGVLSIDKQTDYYMYINALLTNIVNNDKFKSNIENYKKELSTPISDNYDSENGDDNSSSY